jgi:2-amino-4-hydroxy-6-hydroxymethyldihydropteridine diphosphokinase
MGMKGVYLLLGSNLGDSESILRLAKSLIEARIGTVIKASSIYLTKAWGIENQPDFLNQVLELDTVLDASKVLQCILEIERELGRIRFQKWGTRIIDIDILYFGKLIIDTKNLVIPHPENQNRNFVLVPMAEIAPDFMHPVLQLSQTELLKKCPDKMKVALLQK